MKKKQTLDVSLIITAFLLVILMLVTLRWFSVAQEGYASQNPVFEYAIDKWTSPVKNQYIARYRNWNINTGNMTIVFELNILEQRPYWRNIFRFLITNEYSWDQSSTTDYYRRIGVWIWPYNINTQPYTLHVTNDTATTSNNPYDTHIKQMCKIGLAWRTEGNATTLTVSMDDVVQGTYKYDSTFLQPDPDALLYFSDNIYGSDALAIKNFRVYGA